jgi:hypothetical protein
MKCIKSVKQTKVTKLGEIIRTTDEDAIEKVKGGFWVYVPKSDWKGVNQTNKSKETTKSEEVSVADEETTTKKKKGASKKELKQEKKRNK